MSLAAPTPPLLLTKRLTAFLRANLSAQIHSALLTTPSGKLLAHASALPVSALRTQCTVAASLWAVYSSSTQGGPSSAAHGALPQQQHQPPVPLGATVVDSRSTTNNTTRDARDGRGSGSGSGSTSPSQPPTAVTVQLSGGVLVVRRLKCGLLFVCIGPGSEGGDQAQQQKQGQVQGQPIQTPSAGPGPEAPSSPPLGSPSEVASVVSAAPTTTSITTTGSVGAGAVVQMRRHAEELARWLDDKLGNLGVPEEGPGAEFR